MYIGTVRDMADSTITKRALSAALKQLMEEKPFEKISIADICELCNMNRKSFYYHFKDKYDLINWIYDTEFIAVARKMELTNSWDILQVFCRYFYNNRAFYRKTLALDGQNSFSEYFREIVSAVIEKRYVVEFRDKKELDFIVDFYADAILCAMKRWLSQKDCMTVEEFTALLRVSILGTANRAIAEWSEIT